MERRFTNAGPQFKVARYRGDGDWHLENRWLLRHELLKIADQQLPEKAPEAPQEPEFDPHQARQRVILEEAAVKLYDHLKTLPSISIGPAAAYLGKQRLLPLVKRTALKFITFLKLYPEKFELQDGGTRVVAVPDHATAALPVVMPPGRPPGGAGGARIHAPAFAAGPRRFAGMLQAAPGLVLDVE